MNDDLMPDYVLACIDDYEDAVYDYYHDTTGDPNVGDPHQIGPLEVRMQYCRRRLITMIVEYGKKQVYIKMPKHESGSVRGIHDINLIVRN
jgi:hypothetical protein